jgi:N-acetylglucosamine kinase-like BadF-type ATPase
MAKKTKFSKDNQPSDGARIEGRVKRKVMTEALMVALNREADDIVDDDGKPTKQLALIAKKLVEKAVEGDTVAIKEVFDRTEGKAAQAMTLLGDPDHPIELSNTFNFVPVGSDDERD